MLTRIAFAPLIPLLVLIAFPSSSSGYQTWDLASDWSDSANPNGVWTLSQGPTSLPHQLDVGSPCCGGAASGIMGGWAPGAQGGTFLPFWVKAVGDNASSGFLVGDVLVHGVDSFNGNPSLGEARASWTSPISGLVEISGELWYAHVPLQRSSDFTLTLNGQMLQSGSVDSSGSFDRANRLVLGPAIRLVNIGDILELTVRRSPAQDAGSILGVNLTISASPSSAITWGPATDTTSPADVSTTGSLIKAFDSGGPGATVNGVDFAASGGAGDDIHEALNQPSTGGAFSYGAFDGGGNLELLGDLLRTGEYAGAIGSLPSSIVDTVTLTNLVPGETYELQLFFMDQRTFACPSCPDRTMTFSSTSTSTTLDADPGNSPSAPFGQFVTGTFIAVAATQEFQMFGGIDFDLYWGQPVSSRLVNAWQLRAVPEPAFAAPLLWGLSLLRGMGRRRSSVGDSAKF